MPASPPRTCTAPTRRGAGYAASSTKSQTEFGGILGDKGYDKRTIHGKVQYRHLMLRTDAATERMPWEAS